LTRAGGPISGAARFSCAAVSGDVGGGGAGLARAGGSAWVQRQRGFRRGRRGDGVCTWGSKQVSSGCSIPAASEGAGRVRGRAAGGRAPGAAGQGPCAREAERRCGARLLRVGPASSGQWRFEPRVQAEAWLVRQRTRSPCCRSTRLQGEFLRQCSRAVRGRRVSEPAATSFGSMAGSRCGRRGQLQPGECVGRRRRGRTERGWQGHCGSASPRATACRRGAGPPGLVELLQR
jgi:hypothetical protein